LLIPLTLSVPDKHLTANLVPRNQPISCQRIQALAAALFQHYGAQNWWPADNPFEVIVGAILVQRTAWRNAESAIANLRLVKGLTLSGLRKFSVARLEELIRPSGFYRQKATRLKTFVSFLDEHHSGSLDLLFSQPRQIVRSQLLSLNGIGPETADTILLYAAGFPVFIVDTYARRLLARTKAIPSALTVSYDTLQQCVENALSQCELPVLHSRTPNHPASLMSTRPLSTGAKSLAEFHACIVRAEIEKLPLTIP
jgi:endonuclease III-like uncharacterized protein